MAEFPRGAPLRACWGLERVRLQTLEYFQLRASQFEPKSNAYHIVEIETLPATCTVRPEY